MSESGERSVPFFCPYCGEEGLEPVGSHGSWWCHDCNRRWTLKLVGAGPPPAGAEPGSPERDPSCPPARDRLQCPGAAPDNPLVTGAADGTSPAQLPPAGYYPDPYGGPAARWWDGLQWTTFLAAPTPPVAPQPQPQPGQGWNSYGQPSGHGQPVGFGRVPQQARATGPGTGGAQRCNLAIGLLAASVLAHAFSLVAHLHRASVASGFLADPAGSARSQAAGADHVLGLALTIQLLLYLATGIAFIAWFHDVVTTLEWRRPGSIRYSSGWAIGAWFVPLLSLWRPKQMVDDAWRANDQPNRPPAPRTLLNVWWALFLLGNFTFRFQSNDLGDAPTVHDWITQDRLAAVSDLLMVLAAIAAIRVVAELTRRMSLPVSTPVHSDPMPSATRW